jgi:hypothetical protein
MDTASPRRATWMPAARLFHDDRDVIEQLQRTLNFFRWVAAMSQELAELRRTTPADDQHVLDGASRLVAALHPDEYWSTVRSVMSDPDTLADIKLVVAGVKAQRGRNLGGDAGAARPSCADRGEVRSSRCHANVCVDTTGGSEAQVRHSGGGPPCRVRRSPAARNL